MLKKDTEPQHCFCGSKCTVIHKADGEDRQTERQTAQQRGDITADKQMAGKWLDGQKGKESSSQTDRKTDGKLTGTQTDGQNDKWDTASQRDLEA